jgi:hypothetical protein
MEAGAQDLDQSLVSVDPKGLEVPASWQDVWSGESYTGYGQATGFATADHSGFDRPATYSIPAALRLNEWGVGGNWTLTRLAALSNDSAARVAFRFHARDLNLVMRPDPRGSSINYRVTLDGRPLDGTGGADVDRTGNGVLREERTYQLVRQTGRIDERTFEIEFEGAGAEVYCFTFG